MLISKYGTNILSHKRLVSVKIAYLDLFFGTQHLLKRLFDRKGTYQAKAIESLLRGKI